ncbi:MAG: hypothetical protein ABF242_09905 [Flavobacteriales bacterium]
MIYKGIYQKHPEVVEFMILLFISFIVSSIIERFIGVKEVNIGTILFCLISAGLMLVTFLTLGFVYYKLIKKKKR